MKIYTLALSILCALALSANAKHICSKKPCKNGKCIDFVFVYKCKCFTGYAGSNCEKKIRDACQPNPCKNGGTCKKVSGSKRVYAKCLCTKQFGGRFCTKDLKKGRCICTASGDPHYKTYDGQMIHFMGICKYILTKSTAGKSFAVEVKNEHRGGSTRVSYTRMIDVKLGNVTIRLLKGKKIYVNGAKRNSPINASLQYKIFLSGRWVTVTTPWGLVVRFDGRSRVTVIVPKSFKNKLTGICGDCNGIKDDFRTKDGKDVSKERNKYSLIGTSYIVPDDSDKPEKNCEVTDVNTDCTPAQVKKCKFMNNPIFKECTDHLGKDKINGILKSCEIDVCVYLKHPLSKTVYCQAIEALVQLCEDIGIFVDWRKKGKCPLKCGANEEYKYDAAVCQPNCMNPSPNCSEKEEACVCKDGFILSGDKCVKLSKCGCKYNDVYLEPNEVYMTEDCRKNITCQPGGNISVTNYFPCPENSACKGIDGKYRCVCNKGFIIKEEKCVPEVPPVTYCVCTSSGDPHYKTYDGQMIHFMGICKYTLSESTSGTYFTVEVKNEHRGRNRRVSFTRMVDIKFGNVTIRLIKGYKIFVNGELRVPPVIVPSNYSIKLSGRWITVKTHWGLEVRFDGNSRVTVNVPKRFSKKLTGICGDCNGIKDDFRTKDGKDVSKERNKYSLIGTSYIVPDDSDKPEKNCNVTDVKTDCTPAQVSRCQILINPIFKACIDKLGSDKMKDILESCEMDLCAYLGDPLFQNVYCQAVEAMTQLCEGIGIVIKWRELARCPLDCGPNKVYKYKALKCQPTCTNRIPNCSGYEEACVCKEDYILSGTECVEKNKCGCIYNGIYMNLNDVIVTEDCLKEITCKSVGKVSVKDLKPCPENSKCKLKGGRYECVCKKGFVKKGKICVPVVPPETYCMCTSSGDPHYKTYDGQMIHFMGICKYTLSESTSGTYFTVEVKNEHRGRNRRVSFTRMVDIKFGNVTIRLIKGYKIFLNGALRQPPIIVASSYSIKLSGRWITVKTHWGLEVRFDGNSRVTVIVPKRFRKKLTGICGDCNGIKDDFRTKDGKDVSKDPNKHSLVGTSYIVPDDSDKPEKNCNVTDIKTDCTPAQVSRCQILINPIFKACIDKLGSDKMKEILESCEMDVCAYLDDPLLENVYCQAVEAMTQLCEDIGIVINWRQLARCPLDCGPNKVYEFKALKCQPTCTNRKPNCSGYEEACVCKEDYILSGTKCVKKNKCGCIYNGIYMNLNEAFVTEDCLKEITCQRNRTVSVTELEPCPENSECKAKGGRYQCVCKKGFVKKGKICVPEDKCEPNPCKNGATCTQKDGNIECKCPPGFMGKFCEESFCQPNPCKNGGTCIGKKNGFKCECPSGYKGTFCDKGICVPSPCKNGGTCTQKGGDVECKCPPEFTGKFCEEGPCDTNPCKNGGTCTQKDGKIKCKCPDGFKGKLCEKGKCEPNPCQNGGTCTQEDGEVVCKCPPGFTGKLCEEDICQPNPCKNGGTCIPKKNGYKCNCPPGFKGKFCEKGKCEPNPCQNGGTCTQEDGEVVCKCPPGFTGKLCEEDICQPNPCKNGGTCIPKKNGYKCNCPPGFKGKFCEKGKCEPNPCKNGGTCTQKDGEIECKCAAGFMGKLCEEGPCDTNPCKNGGTCTQKDGKIKCKCPDGFTGKLCEKDKCKPNPCQNDGTCTQKGGKVECKCRPGFTGKFCEEDICQPNPCKNGGTCIPKKNGYKCNCPPGFKGKFCEKGPCDTNPCKNGGTCTQKDGKIKCKCPDGFTGKLCEKDKCKPNPCQNDGTCTQKGGEVECKCRPGFTGKFCEEDVCQPNPCKNGGTCIPKKNGYKCNCPPGFKGKFCEKGKCEPNPCKNGGTCTQKDGEIECKCPAGFMGTLCEEGPCDTNPCKNGGTCTQKDGKIKCKCPDGFTGKLCEKDKCKPNPCQNDGTCTQKGGEVECKCRPGFTGKFCEEDICQPNPCKNGGTCIPKKNGYKCNCPPGFKGKTCEEAFCQPNPCKNGGTCIGMKNGYKCNCPPGFKGKLCQKDKCEPNPCKNGGTCSQRAGEIECKCPPSFTGKLCEEVACQPNPCKNGGTCIGKKNGFKCKCPPGYKGALCQKVLCQPNPCKNGGTCIGKKNGFKCKCPPGYKGALCQKAFCQPNPCKNGGTCIGKKNGFKCKCPPGYKGKFCQKDKCTPNPCKNGGICIKKGRGFQCKCRPGYFGKYCQKVGCKPNPCKNGAKCIIRKGSFKCICPANFSGKYCGISSCHPNPCQNNGQCVQHRRNYICNCVSPYMGVNCEIDCDITGDIIIAFEIPYGISKENHNRLIDAIINIIKIFDLANGKVRIGVIAFGKTILANYRMDTYTTKSSLIFAVNLLRNINIPTWSPPHTHLALISMTQSFKTYGRKGYPFYAFVFTFNRSRHPIATWWAAYHLKRKGVTVYAIGHRIRLELHHMASTPLWDHVFVTSFQYLDTVINKVVSRACTDIRPWNKCTKCKDDCNCPPGARCCFGCCQEVISVRS